MDGGSRFLGAVVAATVAVAMLGCVAAAHGATHSLGMAGGYKYVVAKLSHVQGADGPQARCGTTREPSGGGGTISGKPKLGRLASTFPVGDADAWQTIGATQGPGSRTVKSYAICTLADETYPEQTASAPVGVTIGSGAECTAGRVPTGGGAFAMGGAALMGTEPVADVSDPPGEFSVWASTVENRTDSLISVTFIAACTPAGSFEYRFRDAAVGPGKIKRIVAKCHNGEHVIGGGLATNFIAFKSGYIHDTRPWDSGDANRVPDDGWLGRVRNRSSDQHAAAAWAVCDGGSG